jgi:hypothetical protein
MKIILKLRALGIISSLLLLCSCAAKPHASAIVAATELPAEVSINKDAGRGNFLYVPLRMEDGEEFQFMLDTGSAATTFDKSMEQKLGKRSGKGTSLGWEGSGKVESYAAPKLYLGNTQLLTSDKVWVGGSKILGMDCLKHYCIQLDFAAGKIRFLNSDHLDTTNWGKAFPLTYWRNIPYIHHAGLLGKSGTNLLIDMGCRTDCLEEKSAIKGIAQILPDCVWGGETYSNLNVAAVENANVLGLNFLARHLVTFDFPKQMMYLKQTSIGPLATDGSKEIISDEIEAPSDFFQSLKRTGQLPGLSKDDQGAICVEAYSNPGSKPTDEKSVAYVRAYFRPGHKSVTFNFCKNGDSVTYHYTICRASKTGSWKLQRAWRGGQNNLLIEEYSVP